MRLLSQFALRTARTLALLLLALTLASAVSAQTTASDDTIQVIAQQQKLISQTYRLERAGEAIMYLETLALLAAYGDWTRGDKKHNFRSKYRIENLQVLEAVDLT